MVDKVKSLIREKICHVIRESDTHNENNNKVEPSSKRPYSGIWKNSYDILEEAGASMSNKSRLQELDTYLAELLIKFGRENCYNWWADNKNRSPILSKVAQQYLCATSTTVALKQLFSGAGEVYDDKRNRLASENSEMLFFN